MVAKCFFSFFLREPLPIAGTHNLWDPYKVSHPHTPTHCWDAPISGILTKCLILTTLPIARMHQSVGSLQSVSSSHPYPLQGCTNLWDPYKVSHPHTPTHCQDAPISGILAKCLILTCCHGAPCNGGITGSVCFCCHRQEKCQFYTFFVLLI